jgi:hypothetical protein
MTNFSVYEGSGETPYSLLNTNPNIKIGDTIEYLTNNQQGYEKYRVIQNEENPNAKNLKLIDSYDHQMGIFDYESDGGKRRRHKRKSHKKRKTNKKRKTHKKRKTTK